MGKLKYECWHSRSKDGWVIWVTQALIIFVSLVIYSTLYIGQEDQDPSLIFTTIITLSTLSSISHLASSFSNPGVLPKESLISQIDQPKKAFPINSNDFCYKCKTPKPQLTHHCSRCQVCIFKMDHHCPWINNCVGHNNQKSYILFLTYTGLFSLSSLILIIKSKITCALIQNSYCTSQSSYPIEFSKLLAAGICFFFFIFIVYLLSEQYESILTGLSTIDRLKNYENKPKPEFFKNFLVIFGRFSWTWFCPISLNNIKD